MKQTKQGQEILDFMDLVDEIELDEMSSNMAGNLGLPSKGPFSNASGSGPGTVNRNTPNDYSQDQVADILNYASNFIKKNSDKIESWEYGQEWLNTVGSGMKEFMNLRKGDPNLEYKEHTPGGDAHSGSYGKLSQNKAARAKESSDMRGKSTGNTTNRSKEDSSLLDISKTKSGMKK